MKWRGGSHLLVFGMPLSFLYATTPLQAGEVCFDLMAVVGPGEPESSGLIMGLVCLILSLGRLIRRIIVKKRSGSG